MGGTRLFYCRCSSSYSCIIVFKGSDTTNRYFIRFSYDGSKFNGYQIQKNKKTIQKELEDVLTQINHDIYVHLSSSGRTDSGVHAINQTGHFDLNNAMDVNILKNKINKMVDKSIYIKEVKKVSNSFHARFDVVRKEYIYKINIGEYNPLEKDYIYQYNKKIDIKKMKDVSNKLIGEHDFKGFAKTTKDDLNTVREIYEINIKNLKNIVEIRFVGNGFLRYMIRNIVGMMLDINEDKKRVDDIDIVLTKKDRTKAGIKALATGLYLENVYYK